MNCRNCKADCAEKGTDHEKKSCLGYVPITNADRFRSMTDDELADELLEWFACFTAVEWTRDMILDWLKKEVKT